MTNQLETLKSETFTIPRLPAAELFLVQMDTGTEGIIGRIGPNADNRRYECFRKYVQYLESGRFRGKYKAWGDSGHFNLLFVTVADNRVENIRKKLLTSNRPTSVLFFKT